MATAAAKPAKAEADAASSEAPAAPAGKGKKKLIIILAAVLLLAGLGGGAAVYMMKKKAAAAAAAAAEDDEHGGSSAPVEEKKHAGPPTFVPLDPFVVNLADKGADRYAQIAVNLQIDDPKFADQLKLYMPAIRNSILMILAHKTSEELLDRAGKEALAEEIMAEAIRPMDLKADEHGKGKGKDKVHNPITKVHFASFIIQ